MSKKLRIGVIGAGRIGKLHANNLASRVPNAELAAISDVYVPAAKELAEKNIRRMGIENLQDRCYRELSGGQQQRVLLARALCATKKALLLDEPVAGLDPKVTQEMYELIARLNREGITILMISHDVHAALRYASHILHVGTPVFFGTKEAFVRSETGKFFLAQPEEEEELKEGGEEK